MNKLALTVLAIGCVTGCARSQRDEPVRHTNRVDPNAERVIAAMPGDLRGVAAINMPRILESETMSLLLAPLFEDEAIRDVLVEAEERCGISFFADVTRVFMGFGHDSGRVTIAVLGRFEPRHLASCTRVLLEERLGDAVSFEPRPSGYGVVISEPVLRIEVVERDGVVLFDVPKPMRKVDGRHVFEATPPSLAERGTLADNPAVMAVIGEIDTLQALWMVSSGEPSQAFLTEPPTAMWMDASATSGLDVEIGLRYGSGDAAQIGRTALDSMIDAFLGSPARDLIKRIHLSVDGADAVLSARFDQAQTNQLAALLVTAIGG